MKKLLFVSVITISLSLSSVQAREIESLGYFSSRDQATPVSEIVSWTGILRKNSKSNEFQFIREGENDPIDVELRLKTPITKDFGKVALRGNVQGRLTPRFLLWGGALVVTHFSPQRSTVENVGQNLSQEVH